MRCTCTRQNLEFTLVYDRLECLLLDCRYLAFIGFELKTRIHVIMYWLMQRNFLHNPVRVKSNQQLRIFVSPRPHEVGRSRTSIDGSQSIMHSSLIVRPRELHWFALYDDAFLLETHLFALQRKLQSLHLSAPVPTP